MVMKRIAFFMSVLLSLSMFCACSSDDEFGDLMDKKLSLFEDSLQSVPENNYTGRLYYDHHYGWTIIPDLIYIDDAAEYFFPVDLPDDFNMQQNLCENIEFLVGPPGTGKTTYLAKEILRPLMEKEDSCKVLVLTPTNKAADVLVKKIMQVSGNDDSYNDWLARIGTTEDAEIEKAPFFEKRT